MIEILGTIKEAIEHNCKAIESNKKRLTFIKEKENAVKVLLKKLEQEGDEVFPRYILQGYLDTAERDEREIVGYLNKLKGEQYAYKRIKDCLC